MSSNSLQLAFQNLQRWTHKEGAEEWLWTSAFHLPSSFSSLLFLLRGFFACCSRSSRFLLPWRHDVGGRAGARARARGRGGAACCFAGISESQKMYSEKTYSAQMLMKQYNSHHLTISSRCWTESDHINIATYCFTLYTTYTGHPAFITQLWTSQTTHKNLCIGHDIFNHSEFCVFVFGF